MQASARGPAALAAAQYNAGQNTAAIQQATNAQTGQLRAQEMSAALGQYGQHGVAMRSQDEARALAQAELFARQRQQNDAYQLGLIGQANQANLGQLQAGTTMQGILAGSYDRAQALNAGTNASNAANEWKYYQAIMGGLQGGMGPGAGGLGGKPA